MHFKRLAQAVCYPEQTVECLDDNAASEFVSGTLAATAVTQVEKHLASCRDCRALVAALAGDEADSNALTHKHEKIPEDSQDTKRPVLSIGDRVGRYLVLSSIRAGGMGVVFSAYDPQLDRKVALKLLRANLAGANAKEARTRLKREAQAIAQLNHPNVVGVYDVGTTNDDDVYIAMEFVEGDTLTTWLKKWPRTWREILDIFHQAARGLMAAHSVGLLHRDFKPDNVLVGGDGRVRVTDFGLARSVFLDDSARGATTAQGRTPQHTPAKGSPLQVDLTATGTVLGTPRYMPPEQLTAPNIDARADQFSFCVALYEALYGAHPLPGATSVSMLEQGEKAQPPPESTKVPSSIGRAVMRGLEKDRSKRFPTLGALVHELTPPQQRSPVRYIAAAAVAAIAVTGATAAVMTQRPPGVQRQDVIDEPTIKVLVDEINRKDEEIKRLRKELQLRITDRKQLEDIQKRLDDATKEVQDLTEKIIVLKAQQVPNARPIVAELVSAKVNDAIQSVQQSIQFCMSEIDSRALATEGAPKTGDIDALVRLELAPNGQIVDGSLQTSGIDYTPATKLCLEGALRRVVYPTGNEFLDVRVTIAWKAGQLRMVANIVGRDQPSPANLEGI